MFEALALSRDLQEAVRLRNRDHLELTVSDRMIWTMPIRDNVRGKREWIDASCSVAWDWFQVEVLREIELGEARLVELWVEQQYRLPPAATDEEERVVQNGGVVTDVWLQEAGRWRLVGRHPQRAQA